MTPDAPGAQRRVAVVIPVFNEEPVLPELLARMDAVRQSQPGIAWTLVFVNDGSRDRSAAMLAERAASDPTIELVDLSRNFGHQAALMAGVDRAHELGVDAAVTMDADLQDPPELIPQMLEKWREGAGVVLAVRRSRQEHGLRRAGFDLFHGAFNRLTDFPIVANTGTFGLLDAEALEALASLPERHRFFPGLRAWVGFPTAEIVYDRKDRAAGTPAQTLRRLMTYSIDGVLSFSYLPLRMLTYVGMMVSGMGFALGTFFIVRRLLGIEIAFTGFTTLVTLTLFLGGIQLVGIGVIGEYLARVYDEVKQRPLYFVRKKKR